MVGMARQGKSISILPVVPLASEVVVGYPVRSILRFYHTLLRSVSLVLWTLLPTPAGVFSSTTF